MKVFPGDGITFCVSIGELEDLANDIDLSLSNSVLFGLVFLVILEEGLSLRRLLIDVPHLLAFVVNAVYLLIVATY